MPKRPSAKTGAETEHFLHMSSSTRRKIRVFLLCVLITGLCRRAEDFPMLGITTLQYGALFIAWGITVQRRILDKRTRQMLTGLVFFMLLLMVLRGSRYNLFRGNADIERILWYGYYLSLLTIPLLCYFTARSLVADPDRGRALRRALIAADVLLCLGFLTNDLHHLAFIPKGAGRLDMSYTYGPLYYLGVLWIVVLLALTMVAIIGRIRYWKEQPYPWVPLTVLGLFAVWFLGTYLNEGHAVDLWWPHLFNMPEMFCLMILCFWESCIQIGMVPSNTDYEDIIRISGISAVFMNKDRSVYLVSENSRIKDTPDPAELEACPRRLDEETVLHGRRIMGGGILWTEDTGRIDRLNEALAETAEQIAGENTLLQAENEWKERQYTLEVQNRLYDEMQQLVRPQVEAAAAKAREIRRAPQGPETGRKLAELTVLGAFIKRRANLMLLAGEGKQISLRELTLAIGESLEYLRLCGVICGMARGSDSRSDSGEDVLFDPLWIYTAYDFFEYALETALPGVSAVQVRITSGPGELMLRIQLEEPSGMPDRDWQKETVREAGGSLRSYLEEETGYAEIRFGMENTGAALPAAETEAAG